MQSSRQYKIVTPDLVTLGYVIARANLGDKHDRSAPSHFHWKILKCRMMIFSNSSICACPDKEDVQQVHIVFNKIGDDYDKITALFFKFSLIQDGDIRSPTPEMFQMCFQYSMTARMAPTWCYFGSNYLVNNRDFLIANGQQEGIHFQLITNEYETILEVRPVKINFLKPKEQFFPGELIRVLPSLNKATVEEFCETLPESGSFRSYKDLRRHWKNIHGYRLPDEEGPYCTVRFWRGEPLTYPKLCVTRNYPVITPILKSAHKEILDRFLSCFKTKMSFVFGQPLSIIENHSEQSVVENSREIKEVMSDSQAVSLCTQTQILEKDKNQCFTTIQKRRRTRI